MAKSKNRRIGKLPPRYSFILNQYPYERISKCPFCRRPTHERKFAFFIHIDEWGPLAMGKTSKYCSRCELIVVHQHELEAELAHGFSKFGPEFIGNGYLVIGTIEKKIWKKGLEGEGEGLEVMLKNTADFKRVYDLHVEPAGWYFAGETKEKK